MSSEGDISDMNSQHYERPPIVEAVINIQVAFPGELDEKTLEAVEREFTHQFEHTQRMGGVNLTFGPTQPAVTAHQMLGVRFANEENNRILQVRHEGFVYSHLTPYSRWEELRAEAEPLWYDFIRVCQPKRVTRLAVKFINRLAFPQRESLSVKLDEYLLIRPEVPEQFDTVTGFMTQIQLPQPELAGQQPLALVTVASQPPTLPRTEAAVLDIDVFELVDWDPADPRIWGEIVKMRAIKNRIFEAALTNQFKETFR